MGVVREWVGLLLKHNIHWVAQRVAVNYNTLTISIHSGTTPHGRTHRQYPSHHSGYHPGLWL